MPPREERRARSDPPRRGAALLWRLDVEGVGAGELGRGGEWLGDIRGGAERVGRKIQRDR